jgi:hypothetical protein
MTLMSLRSVAKIGAMVLSVGCGSSSPLDVDGGNGATGGATGGGHGGASCADLASQYKAAIPAACRCTAGAAAQCAQGVSLQLSVCSSSSTTCMVYVNDATTLNAIKSAWVAAGCDDPSLAVACPAITCQPGPMGPCVPGAASACLLSMSLP